MPYDFGDQTTDICIYCRSKTIVKFGKRRTKERGRVQRYKCKGCGWTFCKDEGFRWKHKSNDKIVNTIELYLGGLSSRFVAQFERISKNTVIRWIYEYSQRISRFTNRIKPKFASKLHLDELFLKMCGTFFYIWDSICADTRFATIVFSPKRDNKSAEKLILESPNTNDMVFDGAFQYPAVIKRMFGVWWYYNNCHRCKDFEDKKNNNMIERFQNFIRSKTRQRRGFKNYRRGLLQVNMLLIYYNFVRKHMSLGMTPAEKAGLIEYNGEKYEVDRWKFLIKQATEYINSCLALISTVLWYSASKARKGYLFIIDDAILASC